MCGPREVRMPFVQMLSLTAMARPFSLVSSGDAASSAARFVACSLSIERNELSCGLSFSAQATAFSVFETIDIWMGALTSCGLLQLRYLSTSYQRSLQLLL